MLREKKSLNIRGQADRNCFTKERMFDLLLFTPLPARDDLAPVLSLMAIRLRPRR